MREVDPKVKALLEKGQFNSERRTRNRKAIDRLVVKLLRDSDKVELALVLEGAAQRVRLMYEREQLDERKKNGLKPAD